MCELGKIIALIKKLGGGGSGASVQSDWNQNDSTAADYVKNRPGAYERVDIGKLVIPLTTYEVNGQTVLLQDVENLITVGKTYLCKYNDIESFATAYNIDGIVGLDIVTTIYQEKTQFAYANNMFAYMGDYVGTFTLYIAEATFSNIPLDPKFIPEFPADGLVIASSTPSSTKKFKITVDDTGTISATEVT